MIQYKSKLEFISKKGGCFINSRLFIALSDLKIDPIKESSFLNIVPLQESKKAAPKNCKDAMLGTAMFTGYAIGY